MATLDQEDFGAGIYRGRKAPAGSVFDAVNALVDDEGQLFERGKSTYKTGSDVDTLADALVGLADAMLSGTQHTLAWGLGKDGGGATAFYSIDNAGTATQITVVSGDGFLRPLARAVGIGPEWFVPFGTVSGTYDQLLRYDGASAVTMAVAASTVDYLAAVGTPARLIVTTGNRAYFSDPAAPTTIGVDSYHELAQNAQIIGADSLEDTAVLFTTVGVWTIANMAFDVVDDAGNVQHIVSQVNKDVVLWGDPGVAAWEGALVVPAVDDVYLFNVSGEARQVSEGIRPLYRSYVKAGYQPGTATVHRGHYFLPVVNPASSYALVDMLVCRLDRPFQTPSGRVFYPWTRWSGHAASVAYTQRVGASTRSPKLLGVSAARVTELTGCLDVASTAQDANSTTPTFTVDLNDFDLGPGRFPAQAGMARTVYETTGGTPTPTMASAIGPESASYTAATLIKGGGSSDGTDYSAWRVNRRAERIRLRFQNTSQVTSLILRSISLWVRQSGRS